MNAAGALPRLCRCSAAAGAVPATTVTADSDACSSGAPSAAAAARSATAIIADAFCRFLACDPASIRPCDAVMLLPLACETLHCLDTGVGRQPCGLHVAWPTVRKLMLHPPVRPLHVTIQRDSG